MIDLVLFLIDFFLEHFALILENWYIFIIWGIISLIISYIIFKKKLEKQKAKISELTQENENLKDEVKKAKDFRVHQGVKLYPIKPAATKISEKINKKYRK